METEIIESLKFVGYEGKLLDANELVKTVNDAKINQEFRNLVAWIAEEIAGLGQLDERISKDDDLNTFMLELSAFLKEAQCPFNMLMTGPVSSRLNTTETRFLLLEYLLGELMAQKMSNVSRSQDTKKDLAITLHETPTAAALKDIAITLNLGKPPDNITPKLIFEKINSKLDEVIKRNDGMKRVGKPLFNPKVKVSDENWVKLDALQKELEDEYNLRRKMLVTRLDCTVQSFQWSEKIKGKESEITEQFATKKQKLEELSVGGKSTDIPSLLAARDNLAIIEKTSSANVRKNTKSKIQRHIMGHVPDRGGRAYEHQPPPPEMPPWQKQRGQGPQGGGGGRGGGRGGGGFNQGNRGGGQQQSFGGNQGHQQQNYQRQNSFERNKGYSQNQGGYNQNQGGYNQNQGGYNQKPNNYQSGGYQQQQYDNRSQGQSYQRQDSYDNRNQGGSRVQGGWSQRGQDDRRDDYNRRDDYQNQGRGRSNYNRGGRR